jgi:hypothetical protein
MDNAKPITGSTTKYSIAAIAAPAFLPVAVPIGTATNRRTADAPVGLEFAQLANSGP